MKLRFSLYFTDFNIKSILVLTILSIVTIVLHRAGVMDIELDLQSPTVYSFNAPILDGEVEGELSQVDGKFQTKCVALELKAYTSCGISIGLGPGITDGEHDLTKGLNLSKYDRISLQVTHNAPHNDDRLRISLRQYDPKISNPNEFVSLKYNSVVYLAEQGMGALNIPLASFRVDDWWLKAFKISFDNAQIDFSNIVFFEIISDSITQPGEYFYRIDQAILYGQVYSELELIKFILLVWLFVFLFLAFRQSKKMAEIAQTDLLTGLKNRRGISEIVDRLLKKGRNAADTKGTYLYYFDVDGFKDINDTHGHQIGDQLLLQLGEKLKDIIYYFEQQGSKVCSARLGSDQFVFAISDIDDAKANELAQQLVDKASEPMSVDNRLIKIGISAGVVKFGSDIKSFDALLDRADTAMYVAKKEGKNCYRIFDDRIKELVYKRKKIAADLKQALDDNQLELYYMPIVDAKTKIIRKVEVLLRTSSPALSNIGPDIFIPIAEEFGIIQAIDLWVIEECLQQLKQNRELCKQYKFITCINISSKEVNNVKFIDDFSRLLETYQIAPDTLELEITETSMVEVDDKTISVLQNIRSLGVFLALDDFGTGYSAFHHIVKYPIDCLKIDKSFIDNYHEDNVTSIATIKAMVAIAQSHKLETVAEGVETVQQSEFLEALNCDLLQGYLYSKPVKWSDFIKLLSHRP